MTFRKLATRKSLTASLALCLPFGAHAAGDDYFAELPVVLSVSRMAQPLREAPGAVTVIDQELIRASGARVLSDLMRLVPGFQVTSPNQEAPRVTYHGLGEQFPSRLQVLVDGISQYSPLYQSGVNWNLLPVALENIERIEVLRGSNSVAYGANAFLGVVNIITLQAAQTRGPALSVSSGSGGINDYFVRWGGKAPGADFRFSIREQRDNGLDKYHDEKMTIPRYNDDRHNRVINLRADLYPSDRDVVRLGFNEVSNVNGQDDIVHDFTQRNRSFQLGWQRTLSPGEDFRINYALTREFGNDTHLEYPAKAPGAILGVNYGGHAERHDFDAQHSFSPTTGIRMVWGIGARAEAVNQPLFYFGDVRQARHSKRLFANLEWSLAPRWLLNAGGSIEHDTLGGTMPAPRLSLHHHVDDENTLRVGASRAFRAPSLFEQRGDWRWVALDTSAPAFAGKYQTQFLARNRLTPERVDSVEIGYLGDYKRINASLDVRAFLERIPNRIQVASAPLGAPSCPDPNSLTCLFSLPADYALNAEKVTIRGVEYQLRWQPLADTRLLVNQSFTTIRSSLVDGTFNAVDANRIMRQSESSAPETTSTIMLIQKLPWNVELSLTQHHVSPIRWTQNQAPLPAYIRTDWRLAKSFRVGPQNFELAYAGRSTTSEYGDFRVNFVITPRHFVSLSMNL